MRISDWSSDVCSSDLLNPMFTPAKVGAFEHKVRERAREYIATFKDRGHCDFFKEFAVPYPVSIFLDLLGLPIDRMAEFLEWEWALIHAPDIDDRAAGVRAVKAYRSEERRVGKEGVRTCKSRG